MTWIEATCPTCGTVECKPNGFKLAICTDATASYYTFECPVCEERIQKHADDRVVELLVAEGITPTRWDFPGEMREAHDGPPITIDDVLDMHLLLTQPDWFSELIQTTR